MTMQSQVRAVAIFTWKLLDFHLKVLWILGFASEEAKQHSGADEERTRFGISTKLIVNFMSLIILFWNQANISSCQLLKN